ncbi:hypothetical protein BaRGS_00029663 [Batillaria attramentaria]|uniref:WSC domain-containing protein n=1 Tax=Batillaria attramentaria TaxID=370345 RepID=A0ABD0JWJ4_9CAEN
MVVEGGRGRRGGGVREKGVLVPLAQNLDLAGHSVTPRLGPTACQSLPAAVTAVPQLIENFASNGQVDSTTPDYNGDNSTDNTNTGSQLNTTTPDYHEDNSTDHTNTGSQPSPTSPDSNGDDTTEEVTLPPKSCPSPSPTAELDFYPKLTMYEANSTIYWNCLQSLECQFLQGNSSQTCLEDEHVSSCSNVDEITAYYADMTFTSPVAGTSNACGSKVTFRCYPGYQLRENLTKVTVTCEDPGAWSRQIEHVVCQEKTYFLGCRKFNPSDLANSLWTSLNRNGEFECRDFCQKASYKVSILVGSDQCLCTDDNVQSFTGVNPQDCDQACAGQEDEYCGGAVHADVTTVTGALYWTVGGCYTGLDIINAAPKYSVAHPQMTPVVCRQSCALQSHHYAALSATNCTCFDDEDVSLLHVQDLVTHREACTTKCDEDASELCGGPDGTTVYSLEMLYESPESCYDLFRLGVRSHGYYVFKSGIHFCYMAGEIVADRQTTKKAARHE